VWQVATAQVWDRMGQQRRRGKDVLGGKEGQEEAQRRLLFSQGSQIE
jgi:hypothetical protein